MKNFYLLLFFCFTITVSKAQIVNIPDANLKAKLVSANPTNYIATTAGTVYIKIDTNNDGEIQVSEAQQVYGLSLANDNISNLTGLSSFPNLQTLICSHNPLGSVNFQNYNSLRYLNIESCSLTSLNVNGSTSLKSLVCGHNLLTSFSLANLPNLIALSCDNNSMTSLTMTGLPNLQELYIGYNQLTSFDFTGYNNLTHFNCIYNNFTTIDTSVRPNIHTKINCSYNPNLTSINIKDNYVGVDNGNWSQPKMSSPLAIPPPLTPPDIEFKVTPNLQYICADAGEMAYVQNKINTSGYTNPNCQLSSTCEFLNPPTSNATTASACGNYIWSYNNQTYTASGTYTVVTGNHTEILNLTINNSLITTQPIAPILCTTVGSSATVAISTNIAAPSYLWQYRVITATQSNPAWVNITATTAGTIYSGYTSAALTITRTTTTLPKAGTQYQVIVSGGECGTVTSVTANLSIIGVVKAGTIASATSVCMGGDITFTLGGYVGTSVQWQSANALGEFSNIQAATGSTYTASTMQSTSDKSYRVVVTNAACGITATTATKTITVAPMSVAGNVVGGGTVCGGSGATLKVLGYVGKIQWEYSIDGISYFDAPNASNIPGGLPFGTTTVNSTGAAYMLTNLTGNVYFRAKLTSGACQSVYTNVVQYVIATIAVAGSLTPSNATICSGGATTLTLSNAIGMITWQKSTNYSTASPTWTNIANSNTLSITTGNLVYNTAFRAMVTIGSCSTDYSNITYVYMAAKPLAKAISKNATSPSGVTALTAICTSDHSKVLTIGAGYNGTIQWQTSITSATNGFIDIAGANGISYTVINPIAGANYFRAKFTNSCGVSIFGVAATVYYQNCITAKEAAPSFMVVAYPNPYKDSSNLHLRSSTEEATSVIVYDMTGKLIERIEIRSADVSDLTFGQGYASGLYQVVVSRGSVIKTLRIIKE
jgi:hypothetical protein